MPCNWLHVLQETALHVGNTASHATSLEIQGRDFTFSCSRVFCSGPRYREERYGGRVAHHRWTGSPVEFSSLAVKALKHDSWYG
jgi:hypothetical protein